MENHNINNKAAEPVWQIVHTYTRSQAIADGFQVEVSKVAQEAGITFPVFLTRAVYDNYVTVPAGVTGQDEAGRLWDVLWMLRFGMRKAKSGHQIRTFRNLKSTRWSSSTLARPSDTVGLAFLFRKLQRQRGFA